MNGPPVQNGPTNCGSTSDGGAYQVVPARLQIVPLSESRHQRPA